MTAYIDAADVLAAMPLSTRPDATAAVGSEDAAKIARIDDLCAATAEMIDAEITYDFHRHPSDPYEADTSWIVSGHGSRLLHIHHGVLDLTSVEVRYSFGGTWSTLDEGTDWELFSEYEAEDPARPFDHVQFAVALPAIRAGVRLAGIRGWAAPPARLRELNVAWVRQHLAGGDSYSGSAQVPDGSLPQPRLMMPDDVRLFLTVEKARYRECYT